MSSEALRSCDSFIVPSPENLNNPLTCFRLIAIDHAGEASDLGRQGSIARARWHPSRLSNAASRGNANNLPVHLSSSAPYRLNPAQRIYRPDAFQVQAASVAMECSDAVWNVLAEGRSRLRTTRVRIPPQRQNRTRSAGFLVECQYVALTVAADRSACVAIRSSEPDARPGSSAAGAAPPNTGSTSFSAPIGGGSGTSRGPQNVIPRYPAPTGVDRVALAAQLQRQR